MMKWTGLLSQPKPSDFKGIRDKAMLELLYATGFRVSELLSLDIGDVNTEIGYIKMQKTIRARGFVPIYPHGYQSA